MRDFAIGIDIGGTFTDVVSVDYRSGATHGLKLLTTHGDPTDAVIDGLQRLMQAHRIQPAAIGRVVHATTLFTNALIERRGCVTGLLATRGFRDAIEIGNERKYDLYDLTVEAFPPLVPRNLRAEVGGRLDASGQELEPLDPDDVRKAVGALRGAGVESLAVCLMHAYARGAHEQQVLDLVRTEFPEMEVTLSSDVAPVIREYERMSTTIANAYIRPLATRYLDALDRRLVALGIGSGVLMMLSNGGLSDIAEAKRTPIELLESGPAAGAITGAHHGLRDGVANLLAFDMGGTTAKVCLVENARPAVTFGFEVARRKRFAEGSGMPVGITTIDLIEIGAGGGSIAHPDALGLLKVGPQSAGSDPGPACYGLGGRDPTVTDANVVLGYLNPDYFAGGTVQIDAGRAKQAMTELGRAFDRSETAIAWGIHDVVAENMAGAARVHVAERGRDPRDFVLLCTGGGGPVHAYNVARKIGIRTVLCPPAAGVASAFGLLVAPARADRSRTVNMRPDSGSIEELEAAYATLEAQACATLAPLCDAFAPIVVKRMADGRFVGQGFNLSARMPGGPYARSPGGGEDAARSALLSAFESAYRDKFGRTPPDVPVELVNLRVTVEAPPRRAFAPRHVPPGEEPRPKSVRRVYFSEAGGYVDTPIFERGDLRAGFSRAGPLLVEDPGSTLVVGPQGRIEQLPSGNILMSIGD